MKRNVVILSIAFVIGLIAQAPLPSPTNGTGGGSSKGTVTEVEIKGTANQIAVSGTCDITTSGVCTVGFTSTPVLPNGTTATTQSQADGSTKPATTAYVDTGLAGKAASNAATTANGQTCTLGSTCNVNVGATAHGIALNQGNGAALTGLVIAAHAVPIGVTSADPASKVISDCPTGGLGFTQSTDAFGCNALIHSVTFNISGGGSAITTGDLNVFPTVNFGGTINKVTVTGAPSGSITVDIWKAAGAIPTSGNKISASAPATLSSSQFSSDTTLTGWTKTVSAGDVFGGTIASAATATNVTVQIYFQ